MVCSSSFRFFLLMVSCLLLSACGGKRKILKSYRAEQDNIKLLVKPLNDQESKEQFGGPLVKKGYQPLMVHVENHNDVYYLLHPWCIGLPLAKPKAVAQSIHHNSSKTVASMIATGIFIGIPWFAPLTLLIPAAVPVGFALRHGNKKIDRRIAAQAITKYSEGVIIPPHGFAKKYLFVEEREMATQFGITFHEALDRRSVSFEVSLEEPVS
jgi:hypothetical protein